MITQQRPQQPITRDEGPNSKKGTSSAAAMDPFWGADDHRVAVKPDMSLPAEIEGET